MGRIIGWLFLALLIAAGIWGYFFLQAAGYFLTIEPKVAGVCKPVTGVVGVEDLTIDPETKVAYLSGYDRRAVIGGGDGRGAIWAYDLNTPDAQAVDLTAGGALAGFQPHGVSLYRAPDGAKTLFVINHAGGKHTIEIFDVGQGALTHRRTVTGPELVSPNDLVAVGPDAFYVTNDHANPPGSTMRTVEDYLRLRQTTVYFFDGEKFSTALMGIGGSNGINVSADGKSLYLSAASELTVYVYDRDPATNALTQRATVPVPGFADNIEVLANGDLLLGLHSKILDLLGHLRDPKHLSPSHVMLLKADGKGGFAPETIYYNLGEELSAASVGTSVDKRLLIGAIFDTKILDCAWETAP
jgi:arylesterase/paraoxonase